MLFSAQGPTETGTFVLPDSTALFTQRWSPKTPRAHVLLVHGYAEVDDGKVVAHLEHRDALRDFVADMAALLDG